MITKIGKLKKFGSYQDFSWGTLDDFKNKNLIYGWNYSGKTILSKFFQNLEFKDKNKYFYGAEFEITVERNNTAETFDENSLENLPFDIKVFNSEYVKRVFTWDEPKEGFSAISFYLGEPAGNINAEIDALETMNTRLIKIRDSRYQGHIKILNEFSKQNGKFSQKSKNIRDNYLPNLFDQNSLNKSHINTFAESSKNNLTDFVLDAEVREITKNEAIDVNDYDHQQTNLRFIENLSTLQSMTQSILNDTASKAVSFPELEANHDLFSWVQTGIDLHEDSKKCKFCTSLLPEKRIEELNSYFSKKLLEIQKAISALRTKINDEKATLNVNFPDKKELSESCQSDFQDGIEIYQATVASYIKQLKVIEDDLKRKEMNIFNPLEGSPIDNVSFDAAFDLIEGALKNHNKRIEKFEERKNSAVEKILNHYLAEYLISENYLDKESQKKAAEKTILRISSIISENMESIQEKHAQLSDKVKGQEELNISFQILLHNDQIKIVIKEEKFTLERSGHPASDLSEGEKSAIAFSYFLTELKALRDDNPPKLTNTIIFIDDPVSSLDSNHVFQIRSLLKEFFKTDDFMQLFISTHNFEFFSIMYDSKVFSQKQNEDKRPLYFIKKDKNGNSSIDKMPKSFSNYKSEYVGLFHILLEFHKSADKANFQHLLLLPNALRRFVELYTLTKYPGDQNSTVDKRIEIIFNPEQKPYHNIKMLHWFSHQNIIEKVQQHDDKILQMEEAVKDLIEHLEQHDVLHWKGLNGIDV